MSTSWDLGGNTGTNPPTDFLGTTGMEPLVIKTNKIEQLRIDSAGNVGIGTTLPTRGKLAIASVPPSTYGISTQTDSAGRGIEIVTTDFNYDSNLGSALVFTLGNGTGNTTYSLIEASNNGKSSSGSLILQRSGGNVGIGTVNPTQALQVTGQGFFTGSSASPDPGDSSGTGIRIGYQSTDDYGYINANITGVAAKRLILQQNGGNVGIGTTDAGARLEVRGGGYGITSRGSDVGLYSQNITVPYIRAFLATTAVAGDFYGNVVFRNDISVTGDVFLTGADCAEEFDMAEAAEIEPGTVVVLDQDGVLHQSHQAYDKRVAGVISGAGDYRPGIILDRQQIHDNRLPVALVGKVYCKVDAQNTPIEVGDLLTTSSTPGHAMKADDPLKAFGSVIGKALRSLEAGQGLIPILIALQ